MKSALVLSKFMMCVFLTLSVSEGYSQVRPPVKTISSMGVPAVTDQRRRLYNRRVIIYRMPTKKIRPQKYVYNTATGSVRKASPGRLLATQVAENKESHTTVEKQNIGVKLTSIKTQAKPEPRRGIASTP